MVDESNEGAHGKERENMGRQARMEAFISFFSNARTNTIIKKLRKYILLQRKTTC
jgi:hypothetical protein